MPFRKIKVDSPKVSQGERFFDKSLDGALEGIHKSSGVVSERLARTSEAKNQACAAAKDGRLDELMRSISNKYQKMVVSGWITGLSDEAIKDMVDQAGGHYPSAIEWARRKVLQDSSSSTIRRTTKESKFVGLLRKKAQAEDKTPEAIIDSFPGFLQPLAMRMISHPQETMTERAAALGMKSTSASVLVSTKLCWLVGGPRPQTRYNNWSNENLIELTRMHLEENGSIPAHLRNELWYRRYCLSEPVDIEKIARDRKNIGKRSPHQQKVYDAIQEETTAGRKLDDILLHVKKQLGSQAETYVRNAISPNPVEMPKLGIKLDKHHLEKLVDIIRGGVLLGTKKVTKGFREASAELLSLPESQKDEFIRTLSPFELYMLTQRGLKDPSASLGDLVESMETFGLQKCKHRQTVLRIEQALAKKVRQFLDSMERVQSAQS